MCRFDNADNNDDDDNGHREAYDNTHLEAKSALLSCTTTQAHLHILPPGTTASEKVYWNNETKKLTTYSKKRSALYHVRTMKLTLRTLFAPRRKPWAETARLSVENFMRIWMQRDDKEINRSCPAANPVARLSPQPL